MKNTIIKETYSGLKGELIKLTGKDIIEKPHLKFPEDGNIKWNYQILIDGKIQCLTYGHLSSVKRKFHNIYSKESYSRIWKYEKNGIRKSN